MKQYLPACIISTLQGNFHIIRYMRPIQHSYINLVQQKTVNVVWDVKKSSPKKIKNGFPPIFYIAIIKISK